MKHTPAEFVRNIEALSAFIDSSASPAHAVRTSAELLKNAGAVELDPKTGWTLSPGALYFVTVASRTLVAFRTPSKTPAAEMGFVILGAHTDSPCLRIKERSVSWDQGFLVAGTEPYGGLIQSTWLDRDLKVSGVVHFKKGAATQQTLINLPVHARIPNLAIHLNREINKGVEYNPQTQLRALVRADVPEAFKKTPWEYLSAKSTGVSPEDILSVDLYLSDAKPSEFSADENGIGLLAAPRIDNLSGSHAVLQALIHAKPGSAVQFAALFDHEEIGSRSAQGADSALLPHMLERIWAKLSPDAADRESWFRALANSTLVSVDAAHARHPNYPDKHDADYAPLLNQGIVLKTNVNHRYASQPETVARFADLCARHDVPIQRFTNRADMGCGSTIGPLTSSLASVSGIDIGIPMLAMHSARECAGTADHSHMIRALTAILEGT